MAIWTNRKPNSFKKKSGTRSEDQRACKMLLFSIFQIKAQIVIHGKRRSASLPAALLADSRQLFPSSHIENSLGPDRASEQHLATRLVSHSPDAACHPSARTRAEDFESLLSIAFGENCGEASFTSHLKRLEDENVAS